MGGCKLRGWCSFVGLAIGFFLGWLVFLFVCSVPFSFFSLSLWFLFVYPCILLGALLSFAQYIAFIDQKKKTHFLKRHIAPIKKDVSIFHLGK